MSWVDGWDTLCEVVYPEFRVRGGGMGVASGAIQNQIQLHFDVRSYDTIYLGVGNPGRARRSISCAQCNILLVL